MGQCSSSHAATECCRGAAIRQQRAVFETGAAGDSTSSSEKLVPHSLPGQRPKVGSTCTSTRPNSIQFSVSLDQQSEHSLCIRVEFLEGKSLLLTTSLHGSSSHQSIFTNGPIDDRNHLVCKTPTATPAGGAPVKHPEKNHRKDIHFKVSIAVVLFRSLDTHEWISTYTMMFCAPW
jgi:hypothetical protein